MFPRETPVKVPAHGTVAILKHVALQRSSWGKGLSKSSPRSSGLPEILQVDPKVKTIFQNNPNT